MKKEKKRGRKKRKGKGKEMQTNVSLLKHTTLPVSNVCHVVLVAELCGLSAVVRLRDEVLDEQFLESVPMSTRRTPAQHETAQSNGNKEC